MAGGRIHTTRELSWWFRTVLTVSVSALFSFVMVPMTSGPASAETECQPPSHPEPGPRGTIRCVGGDPGPTDPDPGRREPPEGKREWKTKLEPGCGTAPTCLKETCDFEAGEEMMSVLERLEVYHRGSGWTPVPGEDGQWKPVGVRCVKPGEQGPSAQEVWEAVSHFQIPGGKAEIQPPNGRSLVNFKTNFYTTKGPEEFDLPVGPVTVQIRATPHAYEWDFDDGPAKTTGTPGRKYPHLDVVHIYKQPGHYQPSVTIHYRIEWKYGGNDWQPFNDTLPAASSPTTDLQIVESQSELGD